MAAQPRVLSMIASATEIVCALGFRNQLVGRSHECDFPESVRSLPVCTSPNFNVDVDSLEIDRRVKSLLKEHRPIYHIDAQQLGALRPKLPRCYRFAERSRH